MVCEDWKTKLDTYLDGELRPEEIRAFAAHLNICVTCSADALTRVQMKRKIQSAGKRFIATPEFRKRMLQSVATKPRPSSALFGWMIAPAVVALLMAIGLVATYNQRDRARTEHIYSEVADLHVAALASSSPVDVASTDRHTVKPWFQGKIPFAFGLPELQSSPFTLLGGRMTYLERTPGAHLIYEVRKHRISVFVFQESALRGNFAANSSATKDLSFNIETWTQGGLRYFVIGDANSADINDLSRLFKIAS